MAKSSLDLTGEQAPEVTTGKTTGALGPSDSSDSGSDVQGEKHYEFDVDSELDQHASELGAGELASDTDRNGTGERAFADGDSNLREDADVLPDALADEDIGDLQAPEDFADRAEIHQGRDALEATDEADLDDPEVPGVDELLKDDPTDAGGR